MSNTDINTELEKAPEAGVIPAVANGMVRVSVVMPIYNERDFLPASLECIANQTLKEIEIICIDDGSTDNSLEVLKSFQKKDERIRIVTETNAGPALARNNGIRRVRGEYVAFLDADDIFEPTLLEDLYNEAKRGDLDIVITNYDIYNNRKEKFEKAVPADREDIYVPGKVTSKSEHPDVIFQSTSGMAWNKLFKSSFIEEKKLAFLPDVKLYEDVYFVMTALSLAERIGSVHKTLVHHRVYSEQSRAKMFRKYYYQIPMIYLRVKEFLMHNGMYAPLSDSFVHITASRCYKIYNLLSGEDKEKFWNMFYGEDAEALDWVGKDPEFFEGDLRDFVANVTMYEHRNYVKYASKGKTIPPKKLKKKMQEATSRKRIKGFLSRLFKRNKKDN